MTTRAAGVPRRHRYRARPLVMAQMQVLPGWIDYNGHMTESRYYFADSETVDAFLRLIGAGMDYVAGGHSYYSAETHILHLGEAKLGDRLTGTVQIMAADEKRLHLFPRIMQGGAAWRRWNRCACMSIWRRARPVRRHLRFWRS